VPSPSSSPTELELRIQAARQLDAPSPAVLATRVTEGFKLIRASFSTAEVARGAHLVQAGMNQLVATPDWRQEVLARLASADRASVQADVAAGDELAALGYRLDHLPHWRIVAPPAPERLRSFYDEAQRAYGVPWQYLAAINLIETTMCRVQGLSTTGAMGPMQFMPQTWATYGHGDINDPRDAVIAAGRYLKAAGSDHDLDWALYAYNHSQHYVRAVDIYAQRLVSDPHEFAAYYNWQVFVSTTSGVALLPEGWSG
jgi:membrane-bound lytic murein transglycosylase B